MEPNLKSLSLILWWEAFKLDQEDIYLVRHKPEMHYYLAAFGKIHYGC